jgi:hypothetical protein
MTAPIPVFNNTGFNKTALRISKLYKVLAWGAMSSAFMTALIFSFYQIYAEL